MTSGLAAQPVPHRPREAECAFELAERLGSVNAAATQLGTTQVFFDARPFAPLFEGRQRP
jgi:hypothetical protein